MHLNHSRFRARIALILTRKKRGAGQQLLSLQLRAALGLLLSSGQGGGTTQQPEGKMGKDQPPVEVTHF